MSLPKLRSPVCALPLMAGILWTSCGGRQQAQLARLGVGCKMLQRHLADAAGRLVDDAQERQIVARVEQQTQIGEHVLVFLAIVERQAADDLVRARAA